MKMYKGVKYLNKEINARIRNRMYEVGSEDHVGPITSEELSQKCNMAKTAIQMIVPGYRYIKDYELKAIAKNLYVSEEYLLAGNGEKYEAPPILGAMDMLERNLRRYSTPEIAEENIGIARSILGLTK